MMKQKLPTTCRIPLTLDLPDSDTEIHCIGIQNSTTNYMGISHNTIFTILLTCILSLVLGLNSLQAQISNAPPNEISPWVTGTYSDLDVSIIDDVPSVIPLCVGSVIDEENIIDNDLDDPGTISFGAAVLGCNATISVADPVNDYTAGTWAGFRVGTGGLIGLNVGLQITISTYIDGNSTGDEQTFDEGLISANLLSDNIADIGITTTTNFDEVRITYQTLVGVAQLAEIYHASIVAFDEGPELACNTTIPVMRPSYPMSISEDNTNLGNILAINASSATNNVIDSDPNNFATLDFALGSGSLSVKDELATHTAGTFAGFDMESTSLLSVGLLDGITITTYLDGVEQETASGTSDGILALNSSILNSGNERSQIGFITTEDFDEVQITGASLVGSMNVYGLSLKEFCPANTDVLVCNTPVMATEPDFPLIINGVNTGISGIGVGSVTNTNAVIDADDSNFATIDMVAGVLGSASLSVMNPIGTYPANTYTGFDLETGGLLNLDLLNSVTITTYLDGSPIETVDANSGDLLAVDSGLLFGNAGRYQIGFVATQEFDEVQITINKPVGLDLGVTNVYGVILQELCEAPIVCDVTQLSNPEQPVIINSEATGVNGIAGVGSTLENVQNVISADETDFATVALGVGIGSSISISVLNPLTDFPGGSQAGFMIHDTNDFLQVGLLDQITVSTYLDGVEVDSETSTGLVLLEALGLIEIDLSGGTDPDNIKFIGLTTTADYDEVRIEMGSLASALDEMEVYGAYVNPRTIDGLDNNPTVEITSIGDDNIINVTESEGSVPVVGTAGGDAVEGDAITVTVNGVEYNTTVQADNSFTVDVEGSDLIADTSLTVLAEITHNGASCTTTADTSLAYTTDLTLPTVPTVAELVTNDTTPEITGTADSVDELTVEVNGVTYVEGAGELIDNTDGTWTLQIPDGNEIPEGIYDVVATATNTAGNPSVDATADELTIDTTDPTAPTVDTLVTSNPTPTITGTADSEDDLKVEINGVIYAEDDDDLTDNGDDTWSLKIPEGNEIPEGVYDVVATATDLAGNESTDTTVDELTIDSSAPFVPTVDVLVTNDQTPEITGTADSADELTVAVNGVDYAEGDANLTDNGDDTWTLQIPDGSEIPEGVYNVEATVTDAAGNTATDNTDEELTIDTTGPTLPTVDVLVTNDQTPEITGTLDSADDLSVEVNGVEYVEGDGNLTDNTDGTWTLQIPDGNAIPEGIYDVVATATDAAGNTTMDDTLDELAIDLTDPTLPTVIPLVTSNPTPAISGTADSADELTVEVNGVVYTEGDGNLTDNGSNGWTLQIPDGNEIPDGVYNVIATATDQAGNTSTDATIDELTIDSSAPFVPTVNELVTSSPTPEITGTADSADNLTVEVNGVVYAEGDGNLTDDGSNGWSLQIPAGNEIPDGVYDVVAIAENAAGTTTADTTIDELTIDTAAPSVPTVNELLTSSTTPEITGTADSADELTVEVNGVVYTEGDGNLTDNGSNGWTLQIPEGNEIPDGVYDVIAIASDAAGNTASDATVDELTIDSTASGVPTVNELLTSSPTPEITGTADSADELTVEVNGVVYTEGDGNLTDDGSNGWTLQVPEGNEIPDGVYDVIATATDATGNTTSDTTVDELTIDSAIPAIPTVDPLQTNSSTPEITGTADSNGELTVGVNGVVYTEGNGELTDHGNNQWTLQIPAGNEIPDGVYDVVATVLDTAGNTSTDDTVDELTIDSSGPTQPMIDVIVTDDPTPEITGKADSKDDLTVEVNDVVYTEGDGNLTDNGDNTWTLQVPDGNDIPVGVYDVIATVTDDFGGTETDGTTDELTLTPQSGTVAPTVDPLTTQDPSPTVTGTAISEDDLTIDLNGVTYTEGDGHLTDNGDDTWTLVVPDENELPVGIYDVIATVTGESGNSTTDTTTDELSIENPPVSDISITKTADNMNPLIGDLIKFTVTVINNGATEFSAVEVDEVIKSGFTYQRHTASAGNYQPTSGRWNLDVLNANQTVTLEIWAEVNPTGDHSNIASITASTPEDDDMNNDAEVIIELNCLQVFNEFTPNFDGYNDYFRIECIEQYPNSELKIFNRYGNKVYEVQGYQNDWTGIANVNGAVNRGKELPAGVYYYSLVVREQGIDKSGWLYIAK